MDTAGGPVAVNGQGVALAVAPRLLQGVGQQRKCTGVVADLPDEQVDQARLEDQPGLLHGTGDCFAQGLLVESADQVQAAFDQAAEAGVLGDLRQAVAAQGQDHRPAAGLLGNPLEEVTTLPRVLAEREDLLRLVDGEHGARVGVVGQGGQRPDRPATRRDDHDPVLALAQGRQYAGAHDRGLAGAGRPHESDERAVGERAQTRLHVTVAAEEPLGVIDVVRLEPLPGALRRPPPRLGDEEAGVLRQDRLLEGHHLRRRIDAELLGQHCAELPQGAQCFALGPRLVLREREELPAALAQRCGPHHRVSLRQHLSRASAAQQRVDLHLLRLETQVLEPSGLSPCGRPVGKVGKRGPLPQGQRLLQQEGHPVALADRQQLSRAGHLRLELMGVDAIGRHHQGVPVG